MSRVAVSLRQKAGGQEFSGFLFANPTAMFYRFAGHVSHFTFHTRSTSLSRFPVSRPVLPPSLTNQPRELRPKLGVLRPLFWLSIVTRP